jgi:hypothetical protein
MMGALLGQLINQLSSDNPIVEELIRCRREEKLLDLNTTLDYIRRISASRQLTLIRLAADGLDELLPDCRAKFLRSLGTLSTESNIRFLLFGRDNSGIQAELGNSFGGATSFTCYKISGTSTMDDRRLFLQECFDRSKVWSSLDDGIKDMVFSHLAGPDATLVFLFTLFTGANCMPQVSACEPPN